MQQPDGGAAGAGPATTTKKSKEGRWRKWAAALVVGLLMLAEGALCLWPAAPPALHHPSLAFGCLLGGVLLTLLASHPLWKEWRKRRPGGAAGAAGAQASIPPLPSPFKEAAAFARRRRGQAADEVGTVGLIDGYGINPSGTITQTSQQTPTTCIYIYAIIQNTNTGAIPPGRGSERGPNPPRGMEPAAGVWGERAPARARPGLCGHIFGGGVRGAAGVSCMYVCRSVVSNICFSIGSISMIRYTRHTINSCCSWRWAWRTR